MGKYIVLIALSLALVTTLIANQGNQTDLDTSEGQSSRQGKVLARQIATSAFEMGLSELERDFENWRVDRADVPHEGGTFDLTSTGPSSGPVSLTAIGDYDEERYKITAEVNEKTKVKSMYNAVTSKADMDFRVMGGGCSGDDCVSGIDGAGNEDRHGINLWSSDDSDANESDVCEEFDDQVEGRGDGCDVVSREDARDEVVGDQMDDLRSAIESLPAGDKTVCEADEQAGDCEMLPAENGNGIYYVKGDLTLTGNAQWDGIVYVAEGGSVTINGGGNADNINGSLLMEGNTELKMNGGNRIQYNSEKILDQVDKLPSVKVETIQVRNQDGRFVN